MHRPRARLIHGRIRGVPRGDCGLDRVQLRALAVEARRVLRARTCRDPESLLGAQRPLLAKQHQLAVEARHVLRALPARELGSFLGSLSAFAGQATPTRLGSATCLAALRRVAVRRTPLDGVVRCSPW